MASTQPRLKIRPEGARISGRSLALRDLNSDSAFLRPASVLATPTYSDMNEAIFSIMALGAIPLFLKNPRSLSYSSLEISSDIAAPSNPLAYSAAYLPALAPKTIISTMASPPILLAPCTPPETSPAANSPFRLVSHLSFILTPPMKKCAPPGVNSILQFFGSGSLTLILLMSCHLSFATSSPRAVIYLPPHIVHNNSGFPRSQGG